MTDEATRAPSCSQLESRINALEQVVREHEARNIERFAAVKTSFDVAMASAEKAISRADASVNEFRAALADQSKQLLPRAEYLLQHKSLDDKSDINTKRMAELQTQVSAIEARSVTATEAKKQSLSVTSFVVMAVISGSSAALTLGTLIFHIMVTK